MGALEKHPAVPHQNPRTTVHIDTALQTLSSSLTQLITDNYCCNDEELTTVDFSQWALLECIEIGNHCFQHVMDVKLLGMKRLRRVVIGSHCFEEHSGSFRLEKCRRLKELRVDSFSFGCFSACEITGVDRLKDIAIGDYCFKSVLKVELKSEFPIGSVTNRLAKAGDCFYGFCVLR